MKIDRLKEALKFSTDYEGLKDEAARAFLALLDGMPKGFLSINDFDVGENNMLENIQALIPSEWWERE